MRLKSLASSPGRLQSLNVASCLESRGGGHGHHSERESGLCRGTSGYLGETVGEGLTLRLGPAEPHPLRIGLYLRGSAILAHASLDLTANLNKAADGVCCQGGKRHRDSSSDIPNRIIRGHPPFVVSHLILDLWQDHTIELRTAQRRRRAEEEGFRQALDDQPRVRWETCDAKNGLLHVRWRTSRSGSLML